MSPIGARLAVLITIAATLTVPRAASPAGPARPSLIVVIVVDMLPEPFLEALQPQLTGGLGRLLAGGRWYTQCRHAHSSTETGPGHATLLTGLHPSRHGIILNDWHDRTSRREVYCIGDGSDGARPAFGDPDSRPVSPSNLRGDHLADLIKRRVPDGKVFSVSGKDRAAMLSAGRRPDGAFWLSDATGAFTSNPSIMASLPAWGSEFWQGGAAIARLAEIPAQWTHPIRPGARPDDYPYESARYSRTSPHPLIEAGEGGDPRASDLARRIESSPWANWRMLRLAGRILDEEGLGTDAATDLLVVALSATDHIGHAYGPDSQEYLDAFIRLDGWLDDLMRKAEAAAAGPGRGVVFALSADHGVMPVPETLPGARRIDAAGLRSRVMDAINAELGAGRGESVVEAESSGHLYFDRRVLQRIGLTAAQAGDRARRALSGFWEIARVYKASDLTGPAGGDAFLDLYRNAYDPDRGGDIVLQPCDRCLVTSGAYGTSHGSPYDYDRHVPLVIMAPGVDPGRDAGECRTVDLAPTLAALAGLTLDPPPDGRPLLPALRPPHVDRLAPSP